MKKTYQKPEAEIVLFDISEDITTEDRKSTEQGVTPGLPDWE